MDKKKLIVLICILVLIIGVITFLVLNNNVKDENTSGLEIKYLDGERIKFKDFSKDFTIEKKITVLNKTKENKTYSLEWKDVSNGLKNQSNFTYEIKGEGDRAGELFTSQVPVSASVVFPQVVIEAGKSQTYTISFTYKGSEKAKFTGILKIVPEVIKENSKDV